MTVQPLVYRSEWGDYYLPVEHFTFSEAIDEMCDDQGWEPDEAMERYDGVQAIGLHHHSMDGDEIYECPNYDDNIGDEPDPCLGYVKCHTW
jgi:hypothetical protein